MAKHKHREQDSARNETNNNMNASRNSNIPFGIDPMQLMGLLGGNIDLNNMGNMLASMNTNGFNMGNLSSIAQMMGLNLDNNLFQGNVNNQNNDFNKNLYPNFNQNMKEQSNPVNTNPVNSKSAENQNADKNNKKNVVNKNIKDNDVNLEFLMALRNFVHPDRIRFIDKIIEAYKRGELKDA
ncbi:hypothetical protein [Clostridium sp.]|uniref:hypothetical protein n=1 Tax=Clostridium sp. TaxID=1506 RepID=UPI002614D7E6|nr:hypothetical protein [Clostridium sp.]